MYAKILERSRRKDWNVKFTLDNLRQWILETDAEQIYDHWRRTGYKKELRPSIDRIDPRKKYTFKNMQVITAGENRKKGDREKELLWGKEVCAIKGKSAWCFPSIKAASKRTGINQNNISSAVSGKRKTAGGFRWIEVGDKMRGLEFERVVIDEVIGNIYENKDLL